MTVRELTEMLSEHDDDTEVRLAFQPSWPLQYHAGGVAADDETNVVYISEGGQVYDTPYLPGNVSEQLGWR